MKSAQKLDPFTLYIRAFRYILVCLPVRDLINEFSFPGSEFRPVIRPDVLRNPRKMKRSNPVVGSNAIAGVLMFLGCSPQPSVIPFL